jgi:hypothetical protein
MNITEKGSLMKSNALKNTDIDAAIRQAEIIRSAYIAGACKSLVTRIRHGLGERQAAQHGLASQH